MKSKLTISARLSLILSLTIASSLVASVAKAESYPEKSATEQLSQTITKLVDLGAEQQWLVETALHRATTAQTGSQGYGNDRNGVPNLSVRGMRNTLRPIQRLPMGRFIRVDDLGRSNIPSSPNR